MSRRIAKYLTESGAAKYAAELAHAFPDSDFRAVQHPSEFAFAVGRFLKDQPQFGIQAYAGKRPVGGVQRDERVYGGAANAPR